MDVGSISLWTEGASPFGRRETVPMDEGRLQSVYMRQNGLKAEVSTFLSRQRVSGIFPPRSL